ncbi:MAG: tripartite tricarboxylate transporter TctB family protein [Deinococcota bacterium]
MSLQQDRIVGVLLLAFSIWYGITTRAYTVGFVDDPIGPKAFPIMLAILMGLVSIYLIVQPELGQLPSLAATTWLRMLATLGCFLLYALTLNWLGFVLATALVVTLLTQIFEGPLLRSVVASLVFSLVMYGLFAGLLELSLPTGQLIQQMLGRT